MADDAMAWYLNGFRMLMDVNDPNNRYDAVSRGRRAEVGGRRTRKGEEGLDVAGDQAGLHQAAACWRSVNASACSTSAHPAPGLCAPSLRTWRNARPPGWPATR